HCNYNEQAWQCLHYFSEFWLMRHSVDQRSFQNRQEPFVDRRTPEIALPEPRCFGRSSCPIHERKEPLLGPLRIREVEDMKARCNDCPGRLTSSVLTRHEAVQSLSQLR